MHAHHGGFTATREPLRRREKIVAAGSGSKNEKGVGEGENESVCAWLKLLQGGEKRIPRG